MLPDFDNFGIVSTTIMPQNGNDKIIHFSSSRDNLAFNIENIRISTDPNKKKALKNGDNIIIKKDKILYLNDGESKLSVIKFANPIDFSRDSLINNSAIFSFTGEIPFDLF